ncbi:MAG TPA: SRPBCC family protein [Actinoplanes sp.]|nr:SRPBCC family protein [Actinoplanes sp.]
MEIDRPVEMVFRYLVELNDAQWRSSVLSMRLLSPSPDGVGARHVEVRRVPGRTVETVAEVTVYEPNRRWAVRRAGGPVRPEVTYHLDPTPAGTRLRFTFDVAVLAGAARVLRPLVPLVRRLVYRGFASDLGRLKQRLELADATG